MGRRKGIKNNITRARVLRAIIERGGRCTYRELAEAVGLSESAVRFHVQRLAQAGDISVIPHIPRSVVPKRKREAI